MFRWIGQAAFSIIGGAVLIGVALWAVNNARLVQQNRRLEWEKAELQRIVARLKTERRVAELRIVDQKPGDAPDRVRTTLSFAELDADGQAANARQFDIDGDIVYVDALVVRFNDEYIERGDPLRGHSLHLFRRIFGEHQRPSEGQPLDKPHSVPAAYQAREQPTDFERQLWDRFWEYASSPAEASKAHVRVAQGEAVYQRVRKGQIWQLTTRADGGLEFTLIRSADGVGDESPS